MALTSMFSYVFGSCMPAFCMLGLLYALVLDLSIVEQCLPRVTVFPWHNGHIGFFFFWPNFTLSHEIQLGLTGEAEIL